MSHLTPEQTTHVKAAQAGLRKAKDGLRDAMQAMGAMMDIALSAKDFAQHNDAYDARADLRGALSVVEKAHAGMSRSLVKHFPEDAGEVVVQGPPR